jgi:hypothetical protein
MVGCALERRFPSAESHLFRTAKHDEGIAIDYANDWTVERPGVGRLCENDYEYGERAIGVAQLPQHTVVEQISSPPVIPENSEESSSRGRE